MSKIINLEFDSDGILQDYDIAEIRQGDKGVIVNATFEGVNNATCIARINFTRPDEKNISNVLMTPSATDAEKYSKTLDSAWFFAKSGEATLTVFLVSASGTQIANGQVVIAVQKTDYSEDPTITPDEYEELLEEIAKKLNIKDGILIADTVSALGNLIDYTVGQLFYIRADGKIYQLNSSYNLDIVVDLYLVNFTILNEVEVVETKTENQVKKTILLKNTENQTFYDFEVVFDVATTSNAGLMSASDKATFDAIPSTYETKAHAFAIYETKTDHANDINGLQEQIDAIIDKADVVDIVGTHAELLEYDTSKLGDNDIIKVLVDETKQNQRSYYRWNKTTQEFEYIGSEGLFYTKAESDQIFLKKIDAESTYQHKLLQFDHMPSTTELPNGEIGYVPSIEDLGETIIGDGLELTTDAQTGAKILKTKLYRHKIFIEVHSISLHLDGELILTIINKKANGFTPQELLNFIGNYYEASGYLLDTQSNTRIYIFGASKRSMFEIGLIHDTTKLYNIPIGDCEISDSVGVL